MQEWGGKGRIYGRREVEAEQVEERNTKDKTRNKEGEILIDMIKESGWTILNGNMQGDEEGEYTYIGKQGSTVIDYVITNEKALDRIGELRVGEKVDSDHQPLEIELKSKIHRTREEKETDTREYAIWGEEERMKYEARTAEAEFGKETLEESWREITESVKNHMSRKKVKVKRKSMGWKSWWDQECKKKNRELKKTYRKWKTGKVEKGVYIDKRSAFRELCERKNREGAQKIEEEIEKIKTEGQVLKFLNQERKTRTEVSDRISMTEWREHFKLLLEGNDDKQEAEQEKNKERTIEKGEELSNMEIEKQISRLKAKKAAGKDGVPNEAWKYSKGRTRDKLKEIIKRVWNRECFPESWRDGIITPIHKKGDQHQPSNYRGIILLNTGYTVYAAVLAERIRKEVEEKNILPESQAGFRKGRSTMDNLYILNHVIDKELMKKRGRIFAFFIDLKAAFDKVDRGEL